VVEKLEEVADSIAVEQDWKGDQRIILFIKPTSGFRLTEEVRAKIRKTLREQASPRHVPALIFEVPDIPYTFNMKKVESIVSNIINGKPVTNKDALVNTESLKFYEDIASELHRE
jgi:acetoacetyl-CoA synthetase